MGNIKPEIIVLVGSPCSGKSTWAKYQQEIQGYHILSRDTFRENISSKKYVYTRDNENKVTNHMNFWFIQYISNHYNIIIDNTHCKEAYINEWIKRKPLGYTLRVIFFNAPLYKLYYRNISRWITTGKWIPFSVIKQMKINFNNVKQDKYEGTF